MEKKGFNDKFKDLIKGELNKWKDLEKKIVDVLHPPEELKQYIEKIECINGVTVVRLMGKVTYDTAEDLLDQFLALVKVNDIKNLVFDLEAVSETDTATVAWLVDLLEMMRKNHGGNTIGLIHVDPRMEAIIQITRTASLLKEYNSEEEAIKDLE